MRRALWLVLACVPCWAQQVTVVAEARPVRVKLGEEVTYTVTATLPKAITAVEDSPPTFRGFEVIGDPRRRQTDAGDRAVLEWVYTLSARAPGKHEIGAFHLTYQRDGGQDQGAHSQPVTVTVESLAAGEVRDIRPPKDLIEVPDATRPYRILLFFLVGAMTLGLFAGGLTWLTRALRARAATAATVAPPPPPADAVALGLLAALEAEGLPAAGRIDEYHIRVSSILRGYLTARYSVPATESTTSEIAEGLFARNLSADTIGRCRELLYGCDLEKFAGFQPTTETMHELMARARRFVESTAVPRRGGAA